MISISGFMCLCVLAEADDFFKMIGPLLIFGIYIVGALAKGWTKGRQQDSEEEPSELRKAVQKRYQEIHQRQVGGVEGQAQPPRHTEPAPTTVHASRPVDEPPVPVWQSSQRTFPPLPVQAESHRRLVQQPQKPRRQSRRQKPYSVSRPSAARRKLSLRQDLWTILWHRCWKTQKA
ncbi:MAG: hypothetical protein ACYSOD_01970 [Planctomycetota bacterium]|jgi:hypothetical protein